MYVWKRLETFLVIANGVGGDATDTKLVEAQAAADSLHPQDGRCSKDLPGLSVSGDRMSNPIL